jgi:hypothetical protein
VISANVPFFECPTEYISRGPCPAPGLVGCCVTTASVGSYRTADGTCYYDATIADLISVACVGPLLQWVTTSP